MDNCALIYVLLYHDISASLEKSALCSCPDFTTDVDKLKSHLRHVKKSNLIPIRFEQLIDAKIQGLKLKGKYVIFTFDGPHAGWFEYGVPLLTELEIPATFFITSGWVGEKHLYPESRHLSWNNIINLLTYKNVQGNNLFDIGCHSMWHSVLLKKLSETEIEFQRRLEKEIVEAADIIEKKTGIRVRSYATPKGKGKLLTLRPYFEKAKIKAIRWATLPGMVNNYNSDLMNVQICYCDMQRFSKSDFVKSLTLQQMYKG